MKAGAPTIERPDDRAVTEAGVVLLVARGYTDAEVGAAFGVTARTARRWRARLGLASEWAPSPAACGTNSGYTTGCRCDPCKRAHKLAARAYRRRVAYARWQT